MFTHNAKMVLDTLYRPFQKIEEYTDRSGVILSGMERSFQVDLYSCGAQSVYMILRYYGKARSIEAVKRALRTNFDDGTDEEEIIRVFRQRKLKPVPFKRGSLRKLDKAIDKGYPILIWWNRKWDHYSVVYGYSEHHIWVLDPVIFNSFRPKRSREWFASHWTGSGIIVKS